MSSELAEFEYANGPAEQVAFYDLLNPKVPKRVSDAFLREYCLWTFVLLASIYSAFLAHQLLLLVGFSIFLALKSYEFATSKRRFSRGIAESIQNTRIKSIRLLIEPGRRPPFMSSGGV